MDYLNKARIGRLVALGKSNGTRNAQTRPILFRDTAQHGQGRPVKARLVSEGIGRTMTEELATA